MSGVEILKVTSPEKLFPKDPTEAKRHFRELAKRWHPDVNKDKNANEVFQHINVLYAEALKKIDGDSWGMRSFELGHFRVNKDNVEYVLDDIHKEFLDNAFSYTYNFKYVSDRMKKEMGRYLPGQTHFIKTKDGHSGIKFVKEEDHILLRDVFTYLGGKMDPKHVAWIMSRLYNLVCYFEFSKITHNDISMDTFFICPKLHTGMLLGGWWYAEKIGNRLSKVPTRTFNHLPWEVKNKKKASSKTDLELIRLLGRELLGDAGGKNLDKKTPKSILQWVTGISTQTAVKEFETWNEILVDSFGPKRFTEMPITAEMVYGK